VTDNGAEASDVGSLGSASIERLACLSRHWAWADEAKARFEQELARGWEDGESPISDHPFGAYYHWCALLCGLGEVALEDGLLSPMRQQSVSGDLEAGLPELRRCRQLLVVIPASLEQRPRVVDLLREGEALDRLRRIHAAFGEVLQEERMRREVNLLDP
jgi:hypothetical protein